MINRFPTKLNSLSHIKAFLNNEISTIIDVGILTSTLDLMRVFKKQKHILIEPLKEYFDVIEKNYANANIDYKLLKLAASNKKGKQFLETQNHRPSLGRSARPKKGKTPVAKHKPQSSSVRRRSCSTSPGSSGASARPAAAVVD